MTAIPPLNQISLQHTSHYENLFRQVSPSGTGTVGAGEAAQFLKKSGLPEGILHKIWELADQGSKGYLDKQGFYIALKLISLAQNGSEVSIHSLTLPAMPPNMGESPRAASSQQQALSPDATSWSIKAKKKQQYDTIFDSLKPINGLLSGEKVRPVLMNSKLAVDKLGKIWDISDIDKDGSLDRDEFAVAMYLVYSCLEGEPLPSVLPPLLIPPSKRKISMTSISSTVSPVMQHSPNLPVASNVNSFATSFVADQPLVAPPTSAATNWVITSNETIKYDQMFVKLDTDNDGLVSGGEIKEILIASGLPQPVLAHIWNLCDTKNTGRLNSEQFSLVMYFIASKRSGKELPQALAKDMIPPSMRISDDLSSITLESTSQDFSAIKELDQISTDIDSLGREKTSLQREISETEDAIRKRKTEIEDLHNELEKANKGLGLLTQQKDDSQTQLDGLNTEHSKYEHELKDMKSKCQDESAMINQLKTKLLSQSSSIKEQEDELSKARNELDKLRKEETGLEQQHDKNKRELESLKLRIQQTKEESKQVQLSMDKLNDDNNSLKEEITQLNSSISNSSNNGAASYNELKTLNDNFEARFKLQDDQTSARATAGSSPVSSISGFSVGSGRVDEENDDFKDNDLFKNKSDPFASNDSENADPFNSDDPFKNDPFKSVSFADDPFAGDPFQQESDPFKSDPFNPISQSSVINNNAIDSVTPVPTGADPFRTLDPFGSGSFVTNGASSNQAFPAIKSQSATSNISDPFLSNNLFAPSASSTAADETDNISRHSNNSSNSNLFTSDPFSSSDPFTSSNTNDPFTGPASSTVDNDPFSSGSTTTGADMFSNTTPENDPFSTSQNDPFASSNTAGGTDPFSKASNDPFTATVTTPANSDPFSSTNSDPFLSTVQDASSDDPWFAFDSNEATSKKERSSSKKKASSSLTSVPSGEDQQLEWAKRESQRAENARKLREKELADREEMEIALALKQSVESSSDA